MQDRPNYDELLEAVASFLTTDVMPNTTGRTNFHARVAANVVEMVRRELASEEDHLVREWEGLAGLLGEEAHPATLAALRDALLRRNEDLSARIRRGDADTGPFRQQVLAHLRAVTHDKVSVTNPALAAEG